MYLCIVVDRYMDVERGEGSWEVCGTVGGVEMVHRYRCRLISTLGPPTGLVRECDAVMVCVSD